MAKNGIAKGLNDILLQGLGESTDGGGGSKREERQQLAAADQAVREEEKAARQAEREAERAARKKGDDDGGGIGASSGIDILNLVTSGTDLNEILTGTDEVDSLYGGGGNDVIIGLGNSTGPESLYGGTGNDFIFGNSHVDSAYGNDGNDHIEGNHGNDFLEGNDGNDTLLDGPTTGSGDQVVSSTITGEGGAQSSESHRDILGWAAPLSDGTGYITGWATGIGAPAAPPQALKMRRYDNFGNPVGEPVRIDTYYSSSDVNLGPFELKDDVRVVGLQGSNADKFVVIFESEFFNQTQGHSAHDYMLVMSNNNLSTDLAQFQFSTETDRTQRAPTAVAMPGGSLGDLVVAWQEEHRDNNDLSTVDSGIYVRKYVVNAASGAVSAVVGTGSSTVVGSTGSDYRFNITTNGDQVEPEIVRLNNGNILGAWNSNGNTGEVGDFGVYFRIINYNGNTPVAVTGEIRANVSTAGNQEISAKNIAQLANTNIVVTWNGNGTQVGQTDTSGTFFRIFNQSGTAVTGEIRANNANSVADIEAAVAALPDGGFMIVWARNDGGVTPTTTNYNIYGQRFNADGTENGDEILINQNGPGDLAIGDDQRRPHIAVMPNGLVVITWDSGRLPDNFPTRDEELVQSVFVFSPSTGGNDTMNGGTGNDFVYGQSGNDLLFGGSTTGSAIDSLFGGSGRDVLSGNTGTDNIFGGNGGGGLNTDAAAGDFVRYADSSVAVNVNLDDNSKESGGIAAGDFITGVEHVIGSGGNDSLTGIGTLQSGQEAFALNNSLVGASGADNLFGLDGNDSLFGDFEPALDAGGSADNLFGGSGADVMYGGTGADVLQGGAGGDSMSGDGGVDTADYNGAPVNGTTTGVDVNLQAGTGSGSDAQGDLLSAIENVRGSSFGDTITGHDAGTNSGVNILSGEDGNDFLFGREGNDLLYGGALTDQAFGGSGFDTLFGGAGSDTLHDGAGGANGVTGTTVVDNFVGDGGQDFVSYLNAALGVTVNLTTNTGTGGDATNDTYSQIEHVIGGNANDILTGNNDGNSLLGLTGNDVLAGLAGGDFLDGGTNATGTGSGDWVDYSGSNAAVSVSMNDAAVESGGHAQGDTLTGIENVIGSATGADAITGTSGMNSLLGLTGNDVLAGLSGTDSLFGGADDDRVVGGSGGDYLDGGAQGASKASGDYADYTGSAGRVDVDLTKAGAQSGGDALNDTLVSIEHLIGSNTAGDALAGDSGVNTLIGLSGGDTLTGRGGDDRLYGDAADGLSGSGGDSFFGGEGIDTIFGHEGNDTAEGGSGVDTIFGGTGQDWASYLSSTDAVTVNLSDAATESGGDALGDVLTGIEHLIGSNSTSAGDILTGSANNNTIIGLDGDDTIVGGSGGGADVAFGGLGVDLLIDVGGTGGDAYDGGKGSDAISYAGETVGVVVNLLSGVGSVGAATGDTYVNIENIIGSGGNDTLIGSVGNNTIVAGSGNDTVQGDSGADSLDGGVGSEDWVDYLGSEAGVTVTLGLAGAQVSNGHASGDVLTAFENLRGSTQDDTLASAQTATISGNNIIDGDQGDDSLIAGSGIETFIGGGGSDLVDYRGSDDAVNVNLVTGQGQGGFAEDDNYTTLNGNGSGIENVLGSTFSDTIIGVAGFNTFVGFAGNDVMFGASSRDLLRGDDGDDTINGGSGGDSIVGGTGANDFADYTGTNTLGVAVDLETGRGSGGDAQGGDGFFDTLFGIEHLIGSGAGDTLAGDNAVNWLFGASGNDTLVGRGSAGDAVIHDTIFGGDGNDVMGGAAAGPRDTGVDSLFGGTGNDNLFYDLNDAAISGGLGNDTLTGGSLADQIQLDAARFNFAGGFADIESFDLGDGNDIFLNTSSVSDLAGIGQGLNVFGGSGRDQISMRGVAGAFSGMDDNVDGGAGNDIIWGGFGNDAISGGDGDDQIYGGKGDDKLFGGAGFDVFYVGHVESTATGTDFIFDDVNEVNGLVLFWGWDSTFGGNFDGIDPTEVTLDYSDPGKVVITLQNGGRVEFERVDNGDGTWSASVDVLNLWDYGATSQGGVITSDAGNSPTAPATFNRDVWSATFDASTGTFTAFTLAVDGPP